MKKLMWFELLFVSSIVFIGCAGSQEISSLPADKEITIDGNQSDWQQLTNIDNENIAFGFRNDSENLYICMITNDKAKIMKIIRGGLDVWLEPENSENKIGIRYPEKPDPAEMMNQSPKIEKQPPGMQNQNGQRPPEMSEEKNFDPGLMNELSKQKDLYVLNGDEKVVKSYPIDGETFKLKMNFNNGVLCYELKVPLGKSLSYPNGLITNTGTSVNIEFLSGDFSSEMEKMQRPGNMGSDGTHPSGQPMGGGDFPGGAPGEPPGSQNKQDTSPIEYSFNVSLFK